MMNYEEELIKAHQHIDILNMEKNTLKKMMQKYLDKNQDASFNKLISTKKYSSNFEEEMILNQLNRSQSHSGLQNQRGQDAKTLTKQKTKNYYKFQNNAYNQTDTFQNTTPLEDEEEDYERVGTTSQSNTGNLKQEIQSLSNINLNGANFNNNNNSNNNNSNTIQQMQSQNSTITSLQQRIQQLQRDLLQSQQNQNDLIGQLTRERQTTIEYKSSISALMSQLDQLKGQIKALQDNNQKHKNKLQSYQDQIDKQEQIKQHVTQLNREFEDLQDKLEQIEKEKEEYKLQLDRKQQQIGTLQQLNQSMKSTIEQLTNKLQDQEALIAQHQSKVEIEKQAAYFMKELLVQKKIFLQFTTQRKNKNLQSLFIKNFYNQEQFEGLFSELHNYPDLLLKLLRFNIDILALFYDQEQARPSSQQGIGYNAMNALLGPVNYGPIPQLPFLQGNPVTNISIIDDEGTNKNRVSRITKYGSQNNLLNGNIGFGSYNQGYIPSDILQQQQQAVLQDQMKWNQDQDLHQQQSQQQLYSQLNGVQSYAKQNNQSQYMKAQQSQQNQQYTDILHRKESLESQLNENQNMPNGNNNQKSGLLTVNGGGGAKYSAVENRQADDSDNTNSQAFQQYLLKNSHSLQNASESIDQNNRNMIQQFLNEKNEAQEEMRRQSNNLQGATSPSQQNNMYQNNRASNQFNTPNQFLKSGYSSPMQVLFSEPQNSATNLQKYNLNANNLNSNFNPNFVGANPLSQFQQNDTNNIQSSYKQLNTREANPNLSNNNISNNNIGAPSEEEQKQEKINSVNRIEIYDANNNNITNDEEPIQNQKKEKSPLNKNIQAKKQSLPDKFSSSTYQDSKKQIRHTTPTTSTTKSPLRTQKETKTLISPTRTLNTTTPNVNNTSSNSGILKKSKSIQDVKNNSTTDNKSYDGKRVEMSNTMKNLTTGGSYIAENEEKKQKVQIKTEIQATKQKHISDMDDLDKQLEMMRAEEEEEEMRRQQRLSTNNKK